MAVGNYIAANAACMKVGDYLGALTAACKLNSKEVWAGLRSELLHVCVGKDGETQYDYLLYLYVCQLNLLTCADEVAQLQQLPPGPRAEVAEIACQ